MAWNKLPKNFTARNVGMDDLDREAEREGGATRFFNRNDLRPQLGRRISKESRQSNGRAKSAELIATRNLVADTAARVSAHTIPDSGKRWNLRTAA